MPAPLQLLVSILLGLLLALSAYAQFERGRSPLGRDLWVPAVYQLVLATPAIAYLCLVHPDWMWLYWIDPTRLPTGTTALVVLAAAAAQFGGYFGGWAFLRARRRRDLLVLIGVMCTALLVLVLLWHERLAHAGSFHEFAIGQAAPIIERKLAWALSIIDVGLLIGLVLSMRFLVDQGDRDC